MNADLSRRHFLKQSSLYGASLWVGLQARPQAALAARASHTSVTFSASEWASVEAITGRILPAVGGPGGIEAGCVNFIDKALANEDQSLRPEYDIGLTSVDAVSRRRFRKRFVKLDADQQDEVLAALEAGSAEGWPSGDIAPEQFFETVRTHTVLGFLADPKYGGNRDYAGWKVMGYPGPRHARGGYTTAQTQGEADIVTLWGDKLPR